MRSKCWPIRAPCRTTILTAFATMPKHSCGAIRVSAISLADRQGGQILNTGVPAGQPIPPRRQCELHRGGFPDRPAGLLRHCSSARSPAAHRHRQRAGISVMAKVIYEIAFNPPLEMFQHIIQRQRPSEDWTMSIFDRTGHKFRPRAQSRADNRAEGFTNLAADPVVAKRRQASHLLAGRRGVAHSVHALSADRLDGGGGNSRRNAHRSALARIGRHNRRRTSHAGVGLAFAVGMAARIARAEMLHGLLINELNHRVKNTLATVQSIASQTFRSSVKTGDARRKFEARLASLGRAHNILSEQKWESAEVARHRRQRAQTLCTTAARIACGYRARRCILRRAPR